MYLAFAISPLSYAFLAATICAIGLLIVQSGVSRLDFGRQIRSKLNKVNMRALLLVCTSIIFTFLVMLLLTNSKQISIAISALSTSIPFMINKQRAEKVMRARESSWPEVIDSLVSALQSGVSISDAVLALAEHAPAALRPNFIRVKMAVHQGEGLELA